jgi:hypothetical protein
VESKAKIVFDAVIEHGGTIRPAHFQETHARLEKWHGKHVTVTVERFVKSKSNPQLAYYFGVVVPLWSEHSGYEEDEMHTELKKAYLPRRREFAKLTGELVDDIPSLAEITVEEMSRFLDRVVKEAALQGVRIPSPEERGHDVN